MGIFPGMTIRAVLVGDRVTYLTREFVFVQNVLLDVRIAHRVFVARLAHHVGLVPHRGAYLPVAMHRGALVASHTRHLQFTVMHIGGNEIIVAEEFIADARTVTRGTSFFDRCRLADSMPCE